MRIRGRFFELTDRFTPDKRRQSAVREEATAARVADRNGSSKVPRLIISVPKRLLRSAVRRNTVKRVVRESWLRAPASELARLAPPAVLVRLVRQPSASIASTTTRAFAGALGEGGPSRGSGSSTAAEGKVRAGTRSAVPGRTGLRQFKQMLRADLDAIWAGGNAGSPDRRRTPPSPDR